MFSFRVLVLHPFAGMDGLGAAIQSCGSSYSQLGAVCLLFETDPHCQSVLCERQAGQVLSLFLDVQGVHLCCGSQTSISPIYALFSSMSGRSSWLQGVAFHRLLHSQEGRKRD